MFQWTRAGTEDRWHSPDRPGGHEWWGFEALDVDRRLAFSLRIAAGDPMDPEYAACMARIPADEGTLAENHILVRAVLYREGRRVMAHSFRPSPATFQASPTSGAVQAAGIRVVVEEKAAGRTYRVELDPGTVLEFSGPPGRAPNTGTPAGPVWDLAWLNQVVRGKIRLGQGESAETITFSGRGVHDHGYGPVSPLTEVRSWSWGWGHAWEYGIAWRQVHLVSGEVDTLLLVDREGEPLLAEAARSRPFRSRYSLLGIPYRRQWRLDTPGAGLAVERQATLGSSPVGMRLLTNLRLLVRNPETRMRLVDGIGMSSVARPQRARMRSLRWLVRARETWTTRTAGGQRPAS